MKAYHQLAGLRAVPRHVAARIAAGVMAPAFRCMLWLLRVCPPAEAGESPREARSAQSPCWCRHGSRTSAVQQATFGRGWPPDQACMHRAHCFREIEIHLFFGAGKLIK